MAAFLSYFQEKQLKNTFIMSRYIHRSVVVAMLLLTLQLVSGCEEVVSSIEIPEPEKKLAVFAFLSPQDTVVEVSVSKTVPTLGKLNNGTPDYVTDATVIISSGSQLVTLSFDAISKTYKTKDLEVVPGNTYQLEVKTPEGLKVNASCRVPEKVNTSLSIALDSVPQDFTSPDTMDYYIKAKWQDLAGAGDYYRIGTELYLELNTGPSGFEKIEMFENLFADYSEDGRFFKSESAHLQTLRQYYQNKELKAIHAYLLTTDQHYYRYHESLQRYEYTNNFSEPVFVYSNIEGGVGVFCAFRKHSLEVKL